MVLSENVCFFSVLGHTGHTMASLFKRPRSPYWWIKWINEAGILTRESTGKRWDSVQETRDARKIRASKEITERTATPKVRGEHALSTWVQPWLVATHKKETTLEVYLGAWENLTRFFDSRGIRVAAQITREHCYQYLDWRQSMGNKNERRRRRKNVCRNTAIHDLRTLRKVLYEAVNRDMIAKNPASKLRLKMDVKAQKPCITAEQQAIVEGNALPEWMRISWTIAINQGCRLNETSLPLDRVDFDNDLITFEIKDGSLHTTKLMPAVKALLLTLQDQGCKKTWEFHRLASRDWSRKLKSIGMPFSFHSTRVTVITKLARAGVNEQMARRFIGHASSEIHAVYTRLQADDLSACVKAIDGTLQADAVISGQPKKGKPAPVETPRRGAKIGRPAKPRRG